MRIILKNMDRYNNLYNWAKQTSGIALRAVLTFNSVCIISFLSLGGDFVVGKTSMKAGNGSSIVFSGNLKLAEGASVVNNGNAYFSNKQNAELNLGSLLDGEGQYSIQGNADVTIKGLGFSALKVNSGKSVYVESDLSIVRELTLASGIVDVATGKTLKIESPDKDAIIFTNSYSNQSFIQGTLSRNSAVGVSYAFPVGTVFSGFHPFSVDGLISPDYISVLYQPDFDDKWNSLYETSKGVRLEDFGGWQVDTKNPETTFRPYLSLFSASGVKNGNYILFYSKDPNVTPVEFTLDNYSGLSTDNNSITTKLAGNLSGMFAVNALKIVVNADGETVPVLSNFIVANGNGRTTFEVPAIDDYKQVTLSIFNRFGRMIYKSSNYANDFDTKNFPSGTYFYDLTLTTKDTKKLLVRNIIEITRHK